MEAVANLTEELSSLSAEHSDELQARLPRIASNCYGTPLIATERL